MRTPRTTNAHVFRYIGPTMEHSPLKRHVISALVTNEPGVLAQVAGMFAARGFNIDSLVVGRTENPELSRMTIVVSGDDAMVDQVRKQLQKLVPVVKTVDYQSVRYVERDLMLLSVSTSSDGGASAGQRGEVIELANLFRAKVVDVSPEQLMIELAGTEEKIEAFIELMKPFGIVELARTGVIAMPRGTTTDTEGGKASLRTNIKPTGKGKSRKAGPDIDPSSLPPG